MLELYHIAANKCDFHEKRIFYLNLVHNMEVYVDWNDGLV